MENTKKYKKLFGNTLIFALGSFGSKLISFFLVPLYTNVLTKSQYGTADLISTFSFVLVPICGLVIHDALLRFGLNKSNDSSSAIKNAFIVFLFGVGLNIALLPLLNLYAPISEWKWYIVFLSVSTMLNNITFTYAKVKNKNVSFAVASIVQTLIIACLNLLFLLVFKMSISGYVLANAFGVLVPAIVLFFTTGAFKDCIFSRFNKDLFIGMLKYSAPLILNNISWWILSSSDKVMIEYYLGASDLGFYTAASKIPALLSIITTIFSQAWTISSISEYDSEKDKNFFSRIFCGFYITLSVGATLLLLILKPFMRVYVGQEFYDSWSLIPLLVVGTVFYSYGSFFGGIYNSVKKNVAVTVTTLIAAISNIILNILLLKTLGVIAASISTAISYFLIGTIRMLHSRKFFKFPINFLQFWLSSSVIIAAAILIYFDLNIYIVSSVALVVVVAINVDKIRSLFSLLVNWLKNKGNKV